jgi:hypothetical protein
VIRKTFAFSLVWLLAACGDSSGPQAGGIVIVTGDLQSGPSGGNPPLPLRVRVTGSGGAPFSGARVTWQVVSGAGTLTPTSSTTDAQGEATTTVTLGAPGSVQVRATVSGPQPVTFQLTSITPCLYLAPFASDVTAAGNLTSADCSEFGDGTFVDYYGLTLTSQSTVVLTMRSTAVDAFLWVFDIAGDALALDDDGGVGTNGTDSRIKAVLHAGSYAVGANTFDNTPAFGAYTLTSASTALTVAGCEDIWLTESVAVTEAVATTDCAAPDPGGGNFYSDAFLIVLFNGQSATFTETSSAFDAYLTLYRIDQTAATIVAENDNGGGGTNAQIAFTSAQDAVYILDVGTATINTSGAYNLSVSGITPAPPLGASVRRAPPHERLDIPRARLSRPLRRR